MLAATASNALGPSTLSRARAPLPLGPGVVHVLGGIIIAMAMRIPVVIVVVVIVIVIAMAVRMRVPDTIKMFVRVQMGLIRSLGSVLIAVDAHHLLFEASALG